MEMLNRTIEQLEQEHDVVALVRALDKAPFADPDHIDSQEALDIEDALQRLRHPEVAESLIEIMIGHRQSERDILERARKVEEEATAQVPGAGVYRSVAVFGRSPAESLRGEATCHSRRSTTALRCLVKSRRVDAIRTALLRPDVAGDAAPWSRDIRRDLENALGQLKRYW